MTQKQMLALEYASGLNNSHPSYSVATRLEAKGLIKWIGPSLRNNFHGLDKNCLTESGLKRGWKITTKGQEVLKHEQEKSKIR